MANQELIDWIKNQKANGFTDQELKDFYLKSGGNEELYNETIKLIQGGSNPKGNKKIIFVSFFALMLLVLIVGSFYFLNKKKTDLTVDKKNKEIIVAEKSICSFKISGLYANFGQSNEGGEGDKYIHFYIDALLQNMNSETHFLEKINVKIFTKDNTKVLVEGDFVVNNNLESLDYIPFNVGLILDTSSGTGKGYKISDDFRIKYFPIFTDCRAEQDISLAKKGETPSWGGWDGFMQYLDTIDSDKDGLSDKKERDIGTYRYNPDSDNDGLSDGEEVKSGKNPRSNGKTKDNSDGIPLVVEKDYSKENIVINNNLLRLLTEEPIGLEEEYFDKTETPADMHPCDLTFGLIIGQDTIITQEGISIDLYEQVQEIYPELSKEAFETVPEKIVIETEKGNVEIEIMENHLDNPNSYKRFCFPDELLCEKFSNNCCFDVNSWTILDINGYRTKILHEGVNRYIFENDLEIILATNIDEATVGFCLDSDSEIINIKGFNGSNEEIDNFLIEGNEASVEKKKISVSLENEETRDARRLSDIKTLQTAIELYTMDNRMVPNPINSVNPWSGEVNSLTSILSDYLPGGLPKDPLEEDPRDWIYCFNPDSDSYLVATSLEQKKDVDWEIDNVSGWESGECISSNGGVNENPVCSDNIGVIGRSSNITAVCYGSSDDLRNKY